MGFALAQQFPSILPIFWTKRMPKTGRYYFKKSTVSSEFMFAPGCSKNLAPYQCSKLLRFWTDLLRKTLSLSFPHWIIVILRQLATASNRASAATLAQTWLDISPLNTLACNCLPSTISLPKSLTCSTRCTIGSLPSLASSPGRSACPCTYEL